MNRHLVAAACAALCGTAAAAGNTPIKSQAQALRAVLIADNAQALGIGMPDTFVLQSRGVVVSALQLLSTTTTPSQLAASPAGVTLNCLPSGTLTASAAPRAPRVLKLEWSHCADGADSLIVDGPGEVVLVEDSFSSSAAASIRLGDGSRDLTRIFTPEPNPIVGTTTETFNLRLTGYISLELVSYGVPRRFVAAMSGFYRNVTEIRDRPTPGPPFYPQTDTVSADGVIALGKNTVANQGLVSDYRVVTGRLRETLEQVSRPNHPGARKFDTDVRLSDLHVTRAFDGNTNVNSWTADGRVDLFAVTDLGLATCAPIETYTFRTRSPVTWDDNAVFPEFFDGGQIDFNGASVRFSSSGNYDAGDLAMHLDFSAPQVGVFRIDAPTGLLELVPQAVCTP